MSEVNGNALIITFKFPREIETHYGQYLKYFTQFLFDLDIAVDINIEIGREGNSTIFMVKHNNREGSQTEITDALESYLSAAQIDTFDLLALPFKDIAVAEWIKNVNYFQSQLESIQGMFFTNYTKRESLYQISYKLNRHTEKIVTPVFSLKTYHLLGRLKRER